MIKPFDEPNPITFLRGNLLEVRNHPAVPSKIFWSEARQERFGFEYAKSSENILFAVKI